ncbi:MAG: replicative DNA helicase [Proteobacteria bacterium]|nr:replicative DNA helicase [Pseudomonadota bacterium]
MNTSPLKKIQDPVLTKLPPHSIEAEESILSAILIDNDTLTDVADILKPHDFYKPSHQIIFKSMSELYSKGEPVDLVTIVNHLRESGKLEETGGAAYLARLMDSVPITVNAEYHARIIHDKASLRRLIEKSSEIIHRCYEERGDVADTIDFAQTAIFNVADNKLKPSFSHLSELINLNINTLEERQNNNSEYSGIPSGYKQFDALTSGLQNSDLIILAARPSMGKTAFALNMARNVAIDENKLVAVFSLEMAKEQLSMRLLTSEARVNSDRLKTGMIGEDDWQRVTEAAGVISEAPIYIDDSPNITAMEIRAKARRLKLDKNLALIIIDYLQLMKGPSMGDRRDLEIAEISRSLKSLAKELNIPIIALSQLNRMLEQRADKRPMMSDLRESGAIEQDADIIAFIYRDEVYNKEENNPNKGKAELIVAKNRNGATGKAHLTFIGKYTRFENAVIGEYDHFE